jgi:uncharacterized FAD-dependent dehydrogenase
VYDSLAHIGTDKLHRVLPALRERMRALGVEFRFDTRLESLVFGADWQRASSRCARALASSRRRP